MPDTMSLLVVVALVVVAALLVAVLVRTGALSAARDAEAREAADIRTRLEVLKEATADFERDVRQDLANARSEQAAATQAARTELGATLSQHAGAMQQQLGGVAAAQVDQLTAFRRPALRAHEGERAATRSHPGDGRAAPRRIAPRERAEARPDAGHRRRKAADHARRAPRPVVQAGVGAPGAGAQGPRRNADAGLRRRRPAASPDERQEPRRLGRGPAGHAARGTADADAVRAETSRRARAARSVSSSR